MSRSYTYNCSISFLLIVAGIVLQVPSSDAQMNFNRYALVNPGDTIALTLGGFSGNIQWEESFNAMTWSAITGANSDTLELIANTTTYYRVSVTEGTCAPFYTDTLLVKVDTTDFVIDIWIPDKSFNGTTLFSYNDGADRKIVDIRMGGSIAWQHPISGPNSAADVEYLVNGNVLYTMRGEGVYEVDSNNNIVWSYVNSAVWHDADRLPNGNTLITCAEGEYLSAYPYIDPQVIEIDSLGNTVWEWHAKDHYLNTQYDTASPGAIYNSSNWDGDWTHINGVERLDDGNTMISVRNWDLVLIVDSSGNTLQEIGSGTPSFPPTLGMPDEPHNPIMQPDGNVMISEPRTGRAIEYDTTAQTYIWDYPAGGGAGFGQHLFIRDVKILPNGNTLIIDSFGSLIELTSAGEIVWHLKTKDYIKLPYPPMGSPLNFTVFFKAERYGCGWNLGW